MFARAPAAALLNIGGRNDEAVRAALGAARLRLRAADVGGDVGRTMQVRVGTGVVTVRVVGGAAGRALTGPGPARGLNSPPELTKRTQW